MEQLSQLRMQQHELTMRQMVEEIHRGLLNNGQAAAKFDVNRKTVQHWLDKVEQEASPVKDKSPKPPARRPYKKIKAHPPSADQQAAGAVAWFLSAGVLPVLAPAGPAGEPR